jgi:hypothetical protein
MAGKDEVVTFSEYTLSVNKFNTPERLINQEAIMTVICRLLLLTPGTMPDHPDMGVGLVSRWRYGDTKDLDKLRQEINNQILKYLPRFQGAQIELSMDPENPKVLMIAMRLNTSMFVFTLNENDTISIKQL